MSNMSQQFLQKQSFLEPGVFIFRGAVFPEGFASKHEGPDPGLWAHEFMGPWALPHGPYIWAHSHWAHEPFIYAGAVALFILWCGPIFPMPWPYYDPLVWP